MSKVKFVSLCAGLLAFSATAFAEQMPAGPDTSVSVDLLSVAQENDVVVVNFAVNTNGVKMPSKFKTVYVPTLTNGAETAFFESFAVTGEKRWNHDCVDGNASVVTFQGWDKKKAGSLLTPAQGAAYSVTNNGGNSYNVSFAMPYMEWMGDAVVGITCLNFGCTTCLPSQDLVEEQFYAMGQTDFLPLVFEPEIQYLTPSAEAVKERNHVSHAYLDFKVNQTNILPKYMNNPKELAAMKANIDSIKADSDLQVTNIHIQGFASPEGPYNNNVRLAKGRTEALKNYLIKEYKFDKDFITTSWDPAINWAGLREWLNNNNIDNKAQILDIVNSDLADFDRNQKIKTTYPQQYDYLLKNIYPSLRVSDYTLNFQVRAYDNVEEILEVMEVAPNKLSIDELFMAGSSNGVDSDVFAESVQVAVNTYPNEPTANLNAGILAMKNGDLNAAANYLAKAGDSDQAKLARAQLDALKGNNQKALDAFKALERSADAGVAAAAKSGATSVERIIRRASK